MRTRFTWANVGSFKHPTDSAQGAQAYFGHDLKAITLPEAAYAGRD